MSMAHRYRRWFQYEQDSYARVLLSMESVPKGMKASPEFQKCLQLIGHMVAARWMWLFRLGGVAEPPAVIHPVNQDFAAVKSDLEKMCAAWSGFLADVNDQDLERVIAYRTTDGRQFDSMVEDLLIHLYGHSHYHRGQVALLIRNMGGTPAATDFIFWAREAENN
jgi:uncharacterized damage-inducible protein DinB